MTNEQTNATDTQGKEADTPEKTSDRPISPTDEFIKAKAEFKEENDRREKIISEEKKLQADAMLGGTSGGRVEPVAKEETPKEYRERIEKEINEGLHGD